MEKHSGNNKKMGKSELPAVWVIMTAVLLCVVVSVLGFLENRRALELAARGAAQAAAQVQRISEGLLDSGDWSGYRQMEDPLLVLVNQWTPLPENWKVTPRMVHDEIVDLRMYDDLMDMFDAAGKEEVWFWVASGYRSVEEQEAVLGRAVEANRKAGMGESAARETALRTIAEPGCSEHHTGLAIDLNDVSDDFEQTEAYRWLSKHAAEYGFVQRYREDKADITGIDRESWHYRYVGKKHAREMERLDLCLEEYVRYLQKQGLR